MVGKIGEKIEISKVVFINTTGSLIDYIHPGNQLGVIVEFEGELTDENVGRDVAMQVAAMNPLAVTRTEEHTSALQSRGHHVYRRMLEIKKKDKRPHRPPRKRHVQQPARRR